MNKLFERVNKHLIKQFGKDRVMALATSVNNVPSVRIIDTYYFEGSLYIVTHESLSKMKDIKLNKNVSLCMNTNEFQGEAYNIGHPLDEKNKEIRELLTVAFSNWYFAHNNESDPKMCFMEVKLSHANVYINKKGYKVDFKSKTAELIT